MTTATVSVDRVRPPVLMALGRRPVVTPGVGRFRSGDVVDLWTGNVRTQGLAASESG